MVLQPGPPGKTWCLFPAEHSSKEWPPRFVIETGAEVVFSFTGRVLRRRIEDFIKNPPRLAPVHSGG